jgi:endoglucanase
MPLVYPGGVGHLIRPGVAGPVLPTFPTFHAGVNLGQRHISGDLPLSGADFDKFKSFNCDHIRLEVAPYHLFTDRDFNAFKPDNLARIHSFINFCYERRIRVLFDIHPLLGSLDPIIDTINGIQQIWSMVIGEFGNAGDWLYWEILNEPEGPLNDGGAWQAFHQNIVLFNRSIDPFPTRKILCCSRYAGYPTGLTDRFAIKLADGVTKDPNVVYTFHSYDPFPFTHQSASFSPFDPITNLPYPTFAADVDARMTALGIVGNTAARVKDYNRTQLTADFQAIRDWANAQGGLNLHCGEFGVWNEVGEDLGLLTYFADTIAAANQANVPYTLFAYQSNFPITDNIFALIN